jgi:hypothetical protein
VGGGGALLVAEALAVAAFVALALALWIVVRRAGRLIALTRETDAFRRATVDLAGRAEESLAGVSARIDAVRRHSVPADEITDNLSAAAEAVERYLDEARGLRGPRASLEIRDSIVSELERAARALQMTEHGCSILASARAGARELEAQTSVKRGYLNLLHAREAIARHAARAGDLATPEPPRLFQRRNAG